MKTPDYMSYSKYKKNKQNNSQKGLVIGVTTFFVMLLVFTAIAKNLSPNVDVSIGEDENVEAKESGLGVKRFIDDRLKMIQMEDETAGASKKSLEQKSGDLPEQYDDYSTELDEKVVLPTSSKNKKSEEEQPADEVVALSPANAPRPNRVKETPTASRVTKVYVGYYNTLDQAKVAQGILLDSGLDIAPFVKDLGGTYTLQVGSYSSREKANVLSSELLRNSFPARVVQE